MGVTNKLGLAMIFVDLMTSHWDRFDGGLLHEAVDSLATLLIKFDILPTLKMFIMYSLAHLAEQMNRSS